ncbi:MAG: mechanosensitive ion channel family protein, partial [bacterium]|nr:mechanosensitive ion channel family protein [bacterium]
MKRVAVLMGFCLIGLTAVVLPTAAQDTDIAAVAQNLSVTSDLSSARGTMRTFLEAFYIEGGPDVERAVSCLDLGEIPHEARSSKGRELVVQLKRVIDRTRRVEFEELPADPEGNEYVFLRSTDGEIVIAPSTDGFWRFTPQTVRSLGALYESVKVRDAVEGVQEASAGVSLAMLIRDHLPATMTRTILFLEGWQWLGLILVIVIGVVAERISMVVVQILARKGLERRGRLVSGQLLVRTIRPGSLVLMVLVWWLGIIWLGLPVGVLSLYAAAVKAIGTVAVVVFTYRLVDLVADIFIARAANTESRFDDLIIPLIRKSVKVIVVAIGLVFVAQNLGTDVAALITGLGIGGLAVALAAKDTVSNLFGSITVLLDRPFHVGDWVVIGSVEGTVEEVGFRSTRIRTFYNSLITLPNSNLINASVDNLGARSYRRWKTKLGVAYDTPPEKVDAFCEGIRELIRSEPYTRKDYFHVYLNEFGGSGLEVLVYVFFETPDWATELRERHRLAVDILRLASELGVELAFPTQTLYLRQEGWSAPAKGSDERYPSESENLTRDARKTARGLVERAL